MRAPLAVPVLVLALAVVGCGGDDGSAGGSSDGVPRTSPTTGFEVAEPGDAVTVRTPDDGEAVEARLLEFIRTPALTADEQPPSGNRVVGARFRLKNVGSVPMDESIADAAGIVLDDKTAEGSDASGFRGCEPERSTRIPVGGTVEQCVPFTVDASAAPSAVQLTFGAGFSDQAAEWDLSVDAP